MGEVLMTLKAKYRRPGRLLKRSGVDPAEGTMTYSAGRFAAKPRTNSGKKAASSQGNGPRMHAYWGAVSRP